MPRPIILRSVRCYHCGRSFEVGAKAITVSCPRCFQRVAVGDVEIRRSQFGGDVETCGRISVHPRGWFSAKSLRASNGVEIEGVVEVRRVEGENVRIFSGAKLRGDLTARRLVVEAGATIEGGFFRVGLDAEPGADAVVPVSDRTDDPPAAAAAAVAAPPRLARPA